MGNRLRELRRARGFTQEQLAKAIGVSQKTISAYENNRIMPSVRVLHKLAQVLHISVDELLTCLIEDSITRRQAR